MRQPGANVGAQLQQVFHCSLQLEGLVEPPLSLELLPPADTPQQAGGGGGGAARPAAPPRLRLALEWRQLAANEAAAASLALLKRQVIGWTHQLATGSLGAEQVAGVRDRLTALRRGLADLQVRWGWMAGSKGAGPLPRSSSTVAWCLWPGRSAGGRPAVTASPSASPLPAPCAAALQGAARSGRRGRGGLPRRARAADGGRPAGQRV